jgi:hypothetical protein
MLNYFSLQVNLFREGIHRNKKKLLIKFYHVLFLFYFIGYIKR